MTNADLSRTGSVPAPGTTANLRIQLNPTLGQGLLDGAWWPTSRNLTIELQTLADGWPENYGRIARALYSEADWDDPPRRIFSRGSIIPAASFPHEDSHLIVLTMAGSRRRIQLLVIPYDAAPDDADRAFRAARESGSQSAAQILAETMTAERTS